MGALSGKAGTMKKKVSGIASRSLKPTTHAQAFFRLVHNFKPKTILELGTSLGITTAYLAKANKLANVVTIEGSENVQAIALRNFSTLGISNIQPVCGSFDDVLPSILARPQLLDFVFIDGNHRQEATLKYFNMILKRCSDSALIVLDDIHWSAGMSGAWKSIVSMKEVPLSLDFYYFGIVFMEPRLTKEHFHLRLPS